ncbi:domain protein jellyroll fold domain protein [Rhodopirellula sp. SM50]|nr:LamG-like jellyroll fold domain-containing protein [Rhodopirellula sp. SM50]PAY19174.1 domain protein jellyroll fold domain protein [Rhodopirellula sp. SM50]
MKPENESSQVLRTLILKSQCEPLSESEVDKLNELIQFKEGAEEAAALIDQLCALTDSGSLDAPANAEMLGKVLGSDKHITRVGIDSNAAVSAMSPSAPEAMATRASGKWSNTHWLLVLAASHLLVASLVWSLAKPSATGTEMALEATLPKSGPSASPQLVSMTACVWHSTDDSVPVVGEPIDSGEVLNLVEGIAELRVGEGTPGEAMVRLEGPASIFIRADGQLGFLRGSMTVKSLGIGRGKVSVDMPIGEVLVDGQSSIGLVSDGSVDEVHVFTGQVLVKPAHAASTATEVHLEDGEAVRFSSKPGLGISVVKFEASMANFVSARSAGFDPLDLGEEYVRAVSESQPSIYWRFEELSGESPPFVENEGTTPGMNAIVVGNPDWRQYGTNRVAELGASTSSAFRALEPWPGKPLDEYTIEMWVKPLLFHHGEVLCLHAVEGLKDGRYPHTMMLETTAQHYFTHRLTGSPPNRFRFVHRALRSNEPISATNLFAEQEYRARVWQHVAAQKKGDRQMLWIDGQLSAEHSNSAPLTEQVQILVGQVYPDSVYRRFVGQIDEVAIYERCLSPQELRTHIRAAGRSVARKGINATGAK